MQFRWLHTGVLGSLDQLLPGGLGFDDCRLGLPVQLVHVNCWCIRLAGNIRLCACPLSFLFPLPRRRSSGLRFHFHAALTDAGQAVLRMPQFIRQITA